MCTKVIYSICLVLVLGCVLTSGARAADPNLVGWWKFDEGSGTVAQDSSGYGNHGTIGGTNWNWATGFIGRALNINAAGYVDVPAKAWSTVQRQVTAAFWAYGDPARQPQNHFTFGAFIDSADGNSRVASCHIPWGDSNVYFDTSGVTGAWNPDRISKAATPAEYEGRWQHWAFTKNVTTGEQRIYLNGILWHSGSSMTKTMAGASVTAFTIGDWPGHDSPYAGMIDDFRLYNRTLTEAELKVLAARPKAYDPVPANGAEGVTTPLLQWTAGTSAAFHDVYFGTNPTPGPAEFKIRQGYAVYWGGAVTPGNTYYWRIDEVEADGTTIRTGDVWSFTAAPVNAYNPNPCNGMKWVDVDADLSWTAGMNAVKHDLYFGTNQSDVANGTGGTFKGNPKTTTFEPGTLAPQTTYYWRIDETDQGGVKHPGEVWSFSTMGTVPAGAGLKAEYFHWSGAYPPPREDAFRTLVLTRIDPTVDFSWGDPGSPDPKVHADQFAGRWTGEIDIPTTGAYTFSTSTDDGVRLWVNNQLIIENWTEHGTTTDTSDPIELAAGRYPIQMEYYENGGGAVARLFWAGPCIPSQIIPAVALSPPVRASAPRPPDGVTDVKQTPVLRWDAGFKAAKHNVYFGTDATAVTNATTPSTGIYRGQQNLDVTSYVPSEAPLAWNSTYYWRIDEVNAADTWKGIVWSFTTANFLVVDDFEDYTDDVGSRIFQTWKDGWGYSEPAPGYSGNGTGSTVGYAQAPFAEQTTIHGGSQSMPLGYDNTGTTGKARYSETFREWTSPQDWSRNNVRTLTLYFYAAPANVAELLYVALEDNAGHIKVVNHPDPEVVLRGAWQEWNIELTQFSAAGVDLKAVKKMYIGLGSRTSPKVGGTGTIFIDDIRVYPSRCVPSMGKPAADLSGNCVVDQADVDILVNLWLDSGLQITPVDPGAASLVAHYKFDGNGQDSSGKAHHGIVNGTAEWVTGVGGSALRFDGSSTYIDVSDTIVQGSFTLALWLKHYTLRQGGYNAVMHTDGWTTGCVHVHMRTGTRLFNFDVNGGIGGTTNTALDAGEWYHLVGTFDASERVAKVYVAGLLDNTNISGGTATPSIGPLNIGAWNDNDRFFDGVMDDFRIYDRALSAAEIAWLAGHTSPVSIPADLRQDGVINFKDFAVLADSWLEEVLWP